MFKSLKSDFGAVGDGVTDDTLSIQSAINSGDPIWVDEGVYLSDTLTVSSPLILAGPSYWKAKIKLRTAGTNLITGNGVSGIKIAGIALEGSASVTSGVTNIERLVYFINSNDLTLSEILFLNANDGIHAQSCRNVISDRNVFKKMLRQDEGVS